MDTKSAGAGDMSELERRLSEWRPSSAGLDADGMLFAAGRASVRRSFGRLAWPIVSGCLAVLATGLGIGLTMERSERRELAERVRQHSLVAVPGTSAEPESGAATPSEPPAANSYLASRRILSEDFDDWLVMDKVEPSDGSTAPSRPILKARSPGDQLDR
jgi:hypothetical protein